MTTDYAKGLTRDAIMSGLRVAARMLIENGNAANATESRIREGMRIGGHHIDTRAEYAAGAAGAYAVAGSILAAVVSYPSVHELAGDVRSTDMLAPMLPDISATQAPDGDRIAFAAIRHDNLRYNALTVIDAWDDMLTRMMHHDDDMISPRVMDDLAIAIGNLRRVTHE